MTKLYDDLPMNDATDDFIHDELTAALQHVGCNVEVSNRVSMEGGRKGMVDLLEAFNTIDRIEKELQSQGIETRVED